MLARPSPGKLKLRPKAYAQGQATATALKAKSIAVKVEAYWLQGGPANVKPTYIFMVTFEYIGKIQ